MEKLITLFFLLIFTAGCRKEYSGWNVYYNSKIIFEDIASTPECPEGGVLIKSGLDKNQNDILDEYEIDQTKMICNGVSGPVSGGNSDKQILIQLDMLTGNMSSATPLIIGSLPRFSKNNYPGVDSIVLVGRPYIWPDQVNTATVELYNITDHQVIANSRITSTDDPTKADFVASANCYSSFPDKEISLGIRIFSAHEGRSVATGPLYLYLYRK